MNFISRYFKRRKEKRQLIAEAETQLWNLKMEKFMEILTIIATNIPQVLDGVHEAIKKADHEEKLAELRIKYLREKK